MTRRGAVGLLATASVLFLLAGCTGSSTPAPTIADGMDIGRSITFATADGEELKMDACVPSDRSDTPFTPVVLVHGGAFQEGDRSNMLSLCRKLAEQGFAAFPIDYRLLPASYPAQVDDTISAAAWLREPEQVDRFDIDPDKLSLLGSSAGGIIALSAANELGLGATPAKSVVSLSAGGDLTADALQLGSPDPALEKVVLGYLGCTDIDDCPDTVPASPVYNVEGLPRTLLVHGADELIPIEQADALEAAISTAGIPVTLDVVDGKRHGLQLIDAATSKTVFEFLAGQTP